MTGPEAHDPRAMNDDELTIEALDGAPVPPRAHMAAGVAVTRHLLRLPAGGLTRRRVSVMALGLALVAAFALTVSGLAGQWWNAGRLAILWHVAPTYTRTTIHASAPGTLAAVGAWEHIPLPPTSAGNRVNALAFSPTDPQAALACTIPTRDPKLIEPMDGPIALWRTRDGGQHWQRVGIPAVAGFYCDVRMSAGAPERLVLEVNGTGGCQASHPLLSMDGGQTWRALSPPLPPVPANAENCTLSASVTPRHLYASVSYTVLVSVTTTRTGSSFNYQNSEWTTHSDDDGRTWTTLTSATPPETNVMGSMTSADGQTITLGGSYYHSGNPPIFGTRFWISHDAGESWQPQGILPGFFAERLMVPPGVSLENASAGRPVYALSGTQIPWTLLRLQVAELRGQTWAPLPPLPVGGASADRLGIVSVLTATPDGKLLVLGVSPHATIPADGSSADIQQLGGWLWEWDPVAARWSAITPALPAASLDQCATPCWHGEISVGVGPQGSGAYVWLTSLGSIDASPTVWRVRLPGA